MKSPPLSPEVTCPSADGSRPYIDPVCSANNKLKPGFAIHDGKPVHFPDGAYNLRYLKGSRRVWEVSRFASPTPRQAGVSLDIRSPLG
jgi:hypothetical protein